MGGRLLHAWDASGHVGVFREAADGSVGFAYDDCATTVSLSMPPGERWVDDAPLRFLEGLLPDDEAGLLRLRLSLGAPSDHPLDLLAGLDCSGGLAFTRAGEPPAARGRRRRLDGDDVASEIDRLSGPSPWWDPAGWCGYALAGTQGKFAVTLLAGEWYAPDASLPSTHIVKPDAARAPGSSYVEAATMDLAGECGLAVPWHGVLEGAGRHAYVVERFDRTGGFDAPCARVRVEDLAQAAAVGPDDKYGVGVGAVSSLLLRADPTAELAYGWFEQLAFNVHVGNADAHAKNYSVYVGPHGASLCPLYDSLVTRAWERFDTALAMPVNGKWHPEDVVPDDWACQAERCGLDGARVRESAVRISGLIADLAPRAFEGLPDGLREEALRGVAEANRSMGRARAARRAPCCR